MASFSKSNWNVLQNYNVCLHVSVCKHNIYNIVLHILNLYPTIACITFLYTILVYYDIGVTSPPLHVMTIDL